jgi:hypothetical protein
VATSVFGHVLISRVKSNEKNSILTPFTIIDKLTGPYSFSKTNRDTLNDKCDLYFHDFSFVPLFMQVSFTIQIARRKLTSS